MQTQRRRDESWTTNPGRRRVADAEGEHQEA
jgi:hypothetical protein